MGRPKTTNPALPFPMRLASDLLYKLDVVAKAQRRKPKELAVLLIEDAVAAYEVANGPILLPEKPRHPAPTGPAVAGGS